MEGSAKRIEGGKSSSSAPVRRPEHDRLEAFFGNWHVTGELGDGTPAFGTYHYEPVPGNFFVLHRGLLRTSGRPPLESVQILGYDETSDQYRLHLFDNAGFARTYEGRGADGRWLLVGSHERVELKFDHGHSVLNVHWEQTDDNGNWRTLYRLKGSRTPVRT